MDSVFEKRIESINNQGKNEVDVTKKKISTIQDLENT
jgi:hypothetical protein